MTHDFRFGVTMRSIRSRTAWIEKCRQAEALGFDVVGVPDHLGTLAPFPALMLAAEATDQVRLTTFVLNAPFYSPALLARDAATVDLLSDGRLELGLGAGYVESEFDRAAIPFPTARRRVDQVAETAMALRALFTDESHRPRTAQPGGPPLLIAGWGDRLLGIAAHHADIVALTGARTDDAGHLTLATEAETARRVTRLTDALGERTGTVELNILIQALFSDVTDDALAPVRPHLTAGVERPEDYPTLLVGTPQDMADRLWELRERYGITYFSVLDNNMEAFAPLIARMR
ncbi:Putative F420-dependent oxidoreductase OS=Tsukamurella paurometabola (strain ATCC 8368 / DSM/ CCUG 35730 / CIP 100753 / JCM 10117 / KCTC 9821 / NBRC 16120/ NCIMB 702349 / NCTC 13040) OX=521096 GN=Tpau_1139 PE=4 SV=1 [Tsukamurella paurometabola]|uniref:Putative F420-dependent oxidoreductase n=1 Tax=Tsukamurella paurometabola (strain ATCC 8368 / DSM 20162 / CCUG 35730 / CIP 100753 / JCM 10117 / KCTC 9821 / NBRC 16120 / NCIMB 702349 / NCTC 13040) TaxID=521096 RepID=D5UVW3_TSUPD|nr:TIGR03621 family F420-dependent LLM class oxidoreductase [Tsukamurella paurometabola]ADG77770.1 putative F420-dependent oxidoreductase [Tsukamurella paurometabola DSM 20162]SUP28688.1 Pyrimidine monooxygenase RutA [Tsukamurella paurometabola]